MVNWPDYEEYSAPRGHLEANRAFGAPAACDMPFSPKPLNFPALEPRQVTAQADARLGAWNCAQCLTPLTRSYKNFGP